MGFVPEFTTQIEAFLTQQGAQEILINGVNTIKYFGVSDESSNYTTPQKLSYNQVFTLGGKLPVDNRTLTVINQSSLSSMIFVNNTSTPFKIIDTGAPSIVIEEPLSPPITTNFFTIASFIIDRTDITSSQLNWISDLKLPYGAIDNTLWTTSFNSNGYSDTAIADMNTDNSLLFVIDGNQHAYIDGKSIKMTIPYYGSTVDIYGSYLNFNKSVNFYDPLFSESSNYLSRFGNNVVLLFCDDIQRPGNSPLRSWSTGYNFPNAPYAQGGKYLANFVATPGFTKDIAVGIAYLDKGVIVIFNSNLYNGYVNRSTNDIYVTNRNLVRRTVANFVCDLSLSEFYRTPNPTFVLGNPVRISTIGLFNENKQLLAVGRLNSEVEKNSAQRLTFMVKLVI